MANKFYEENDISAIASAIRTKLGSQDTYKVSEMADAVSSIPTGQQPTGTLQITENGTGIDVTNYASADVNVQPNVGTKTITENGIYPASADNLDGYSSVTVSTPVPTGKKTITVNGIDIDVAQFQYADALVPTIPANMELKRMTIPNDTVSVDVQYDSEREPIIFILIPKSVQMLRYEYTYFMAKSDIVTDVWDTITATFISSSTTDESAVIGSNAGTISFDTVNHIATLTTRGSHFFFKQGDIFDILIVYDTDAPKTVEVHTELQSVGKPIIPQTGTWQYQKSFPCGFLIFSVNDNDDLAKWVRMMQSYGVPLTINTTHQHYNSTVTSDADTAATSQVFHPYVPSIVPNGGTVKNVIDAVQNTYGSDIEVSMIGTSDEQLWDSSLLVGDVLDTYYNAYTIGGGLKNKEDFKEAIMTEYASRDISQGASILESKRNAFGVTYNMFPVSLSCWIGTFNVIIDNINCGTSESIVAESSKISRALNWYADTSFTNQFTTERQSPYYIYKVSGQDLAGESAFIDLVNWAANNRVAIEICNETSFLDGTEERYNNVKATLQYVINRTQTDGDIELCTRKGFAGYGKFFMNPITSISLTVDNSIHYPTYIDVPTSAFTCTANLQNGTSVDCEADKIIHSEVIDINTPGTYTVPLEYRGFFNTANLIIESPPVINYLIQNFSETITGRITNNQLYGTLPSTINYVKGKRYRWTYHIKISQYTVQYANHNFWFYAPDQYNNKTLKLTEFKSTDTLTTTNLEIDVVVEAICTTNFSSNKMLKTGAGNSTMDDLEITNGTIAEVGFES